MARPQQVVTVGRVPFRKGKWLGVEEGSAWRPLAKFRSDDAAAEFLRLMELAGIPRVE